MQRPRRLASNYLIFNTRKRVIVVVKKRSFGSAADTASKTTQQVAKLASTLDASLALRRVDFQRPAAEMFV